MSQRLRKTSQFCVSDPESSFEFIDLTDSSADCSMEIIDNEMKQSSKSFPKDVLVYDPESSFEVINDSADCSMELVEEASEDIVKEAEILTSESPETPASKPSEDVAERAHQVVKSSEPSNTDKRLWKLARKFQKLSGRIENFEAARNNQNSRPILEEISGSWKLVSQEIDGKEVDVPVGDNLKYYAIGNHIEISTIKDSKTVKFQRTASITSEHLTPKIKKTHDYIDGNQWYTLREESWNVKRILNGQLVIEYQTGEKSEKKVFERTQNTKFGVSDCIAVLLVVLTFYLVIRFIDSPIVDYVMIFFILALMFVLAERASR